MQKSGKLQWDTTVAVAKEGQYAITHAPLIVKDEGDRRHGRR